MLTVPHESEEVNAVPTTGHSVVTHRSNAGLRRGVVGDRGSVTSELAVFVVPFLIIMAMFVVFCGRAASVSIDAHAVAAAAARAAADAPTQAAARTAATQAANAMASGSRFTCTASTDTALFRRGGSVTVRVACLMRLDDLGLPQVGDTRTARASATEPIDTYRAGT
ncbi:pilus assembly protein [Micromonospora aurantiaca (nom. illeg.)]|uniref:pilus assembly protein n=1 Tax=Micromonospora aurantiaca (nom. illeg.) TaxID=47850 RepID=UPI003DA1F19D